MKNRMMAASIVEPGRIAIGEMAVPEPKPDEVLIRVKASGICGTDIHIYRGDYIGEYPMIPGHEFSGVIIQVGSGVSRFKKGDRVAVEPNISCDNSLACLENRQNFCENWRAIGVHNPGAMAGCVAAPEKSVFSIGDLPYQAGAFVEPLSCVLHGVQRCGFPLADRVLVVGAGPIGNLFIQAMRVQGAAELTSLERNRTRLELAVRSGAHYSVESFDQLVPESFDAVVDATGVPSLMAQTLRFVRKGGRILLFGVPPRDGRLDLPAFPIFQEGLSIFSSFTSVRNSLQAVRMLQSGSIDVSQLVSHTLPLEHLANGIEMIESGESGVLKVIIDPNLNGAEGMT